MSVCTWWLCPPRLLSGSALNDYMATLLSWSLNARQLITWGPSAGDPRVAPHYFPLMTWGPKVSHPQ